MHVPFYDFLINSLLYPVNCSCPFFNLLFNNFIFFYDEFHVLGMWALHYKVELNYIIDTISSFILGSILILLVCQLTLLWTPSALLICVWKTHYHFFAMVRIMHFWPFCGNSSTWSLEFVWACQESHGVSFIRWSGLMFVQDKTRFLRFESSQMLKRKPYQVAFFPQ